MTKVNTNTHTKLVTGARLGLATTLEEQAKEMKFNPLISLDPRHTVLTQYPELKAIKEVVAYSAKKEGVTEYNFKNQAIKYMLWLYSADTILNTKPVEPLSDRKFKAAHLSGFFVDKRTNQLADRVIHELLHLEDMTFVKMVLAYLRFQKQELFSEIIVSEEQHFEAMRLRLTPVTGTGKTTMEAADLKKKLRIECKELMMDIKSYWDEFWEDHYDLKAVGQEIIYQSIEDRARINVGI